MPRKKQFVQLSSSSSTVASAVQREVTRARMTTLCPALGLTGYSGQAESRK